MCCCQKTSNVKKPATVVTEDQLESASTESEPKITETDDKTSSPPMSQVITLLLKDKSTAL